MSTNGTASRHIAPQVPTSAGDSARIIPAVLVLYACMLPRELTFEIAGIGFQPFRAMITLLSPVALFMAVQQRLRPSLVDGLIVFAAIWAFIALWVVQSLDDAFITGLSEGLNLSLGYLVGRVSIRTSKDFQRFLMAVLPGLLFCAAVMAIESISHKHLLRPFVANLVGVPLTSESYEERLGLMRARGPFVHAILGAVFLASFLSIVWYMARSTYIRTIGLLAVAGFLFSVSSTGYVGIIIASGLIFTNYLHRTTRLPVFQTVLLAVLLMFALIQAISESGVISFIIRRLTISSGTGRFRMFIWEYAGAEALANPVFGIGDRPYSRPAWMRTASVDAHWLLLTMRYGFPFGMSVLVAVISSAVMSIRGAWSPFPLDQRAAYAMTFTLSSVIFMGFSVYLWEGMGCWLVVLSGMAVSFGQQMALAVRTQQAAPPGWSPTRLRPA